MAEIRKIKPQPGYQEKALSSGADIVIGGASAGVGKTFSLLLDPLRHVKIKNFGGVIFRRTSPQIRAEGGLWDTSMQLYPTIRAVPKETHLTWVFPSKCKLKFSHLEYEKNLLDWQGSQIPFIGFDELTHFSKKMFFYLLSRNRSTCGVRPYVRATCNPDPESWIVELIRWWIDEETGFPIPERDGIIRYFVRDGENYIWGNTQEDCIKKAGYLLDDIVEKSGIDASKFVKSITFISGDIYQNQELLKTNPEYLANLLSQDDETKAQLLHGNWKIQISDVDLYDYYKFRDIYTNTHVRENGKKHITADIALKGSDKFVVFVWHGRVVIDAVIMGKSDGKQVIDTLEALKKTHGVPNSSITFDNDGVGGFVDGFIPNSIEFKNGARPFNGENYYNLKTQCFYKSAKSVNNGEIRVSEYVANMMYDKNRTIRQQLEFERKAIKRDKPDADGKLRVIPKEQMKVKLNGKSPDLMDALAMFEIFDMKPKPRKYETKATPGELGL